MSEPGERPVDANPGTLRWAVRLLVVEAAALTALTILLVYLSLTQHVTAVQMALSVTGYAALMAALFVVVAVSLARRRRWARAPAIVLHLLQVPIGMSMLTGGLPWVGGPVLVLGLTGAVLLLAPATRQALGVG